MMVLAVCFDDCLDKSARQWPQRCGNGLRDGGLKHLPAGLPLSIAGSFQEIVDSPLLVLINCNGVCIVICDVEGDWHDGCETGVGAGAKGRGHGLWYL